MLRRFGVVMFAAASLGLAAVPVHAQISKDVLKCEDGTNSALAKFVGAKAKCAAKCIATQRKASPPAFAGCMGPAYTDPTTNACIMGSLKGAEAKGGAAIAKGCAALASCPTCYTPQQCTDASGGNPFIQASETNVDAFGPLVYCVEAGNPTGPAPSKDDAKCEDGISKALVKFVGAKGKCYQKCNDNLNKGKAAPGSCTPPATDPATVTCISVSPEGCRSEGRSRDRQGLPGIPIVLRLDDWGSLGGRRRGPRRYYDKSVYCAVPTTTTTTTTTPSSTTTLPSHGTVLNGALTATLGRFNYAGE